MILKHRGSNAIEGSQYHLSESQRARIFSERRSYGDLNIPKLPLLKFNEKSDIYTARKENSSKSRLMTLENTSLVRPKTMKIKLIRSNMFKEPLTFRQAPQLKDLPNLNSEQERIQMIIDNVRWRLNEKDEKKRLASLEFSKKIHSRKLGKAMSLNDSPNLSRPVSPEYCKNSQGLQRESQSIKRLSPDPIPSQYSVIKKSKFRMAVTEPSQ